MKYNFEKDPEGEIIFVSVKLDGIHTFKMLLDTGASRTTFDITALLAIGYDVKDHLPVETKMIETANGAVKVSVFEAAVITALGHTVRHIPVQVYDFLEHGILSDYEGVLGLDFFKDTVLTIDLANCTIEINPEPSSNQHAALLSQNAALLNQNAAQSNEIAALRRLVQQTGINIPLVQ
jgi:hypothetical protein